MKIELIIFFFIFIQNMVYSTLMSLFKSRQNQNDEFDNWVPNTEILKTNRILCLSKCTQMEHCFYVVFKNGLCSLHTEYAKHGFKSSPLNFLYEKSHFDGYQCICSNGYFGKKLAF